MAVTPATPGAPADVYALAGRDGQEYLDWIMLDGDVRLARSPRHASILLVAGSVPEWAYPALRRIHDQVVHPRAVAVWGGEPGPLDAAARFQPNGTGVDEVHRVAARLRELQADLFAGRTATSGGLLPDEPPMPWRGKGDHGQGGEGMMGGNPYGRPMTMPDDDLRDGLSLDAYPVTLGPFAPMLPAGLELGLTLQGDVIQQAELLHPPFPQSATPSRPAGIGSPPPAHHDGLHCAHNLRCVARLLWVRGQELAARYTLRAARRVLSGQPVQVTRLARQLRWTGLFNGIEPGLGVLRDQDAVSRVAQWLNDAERAAARTHAPSPRNGPQENPATTFAPGREDRTGSPAAVLHRLLVGLEWGQAVTVLASFEVNVLHRLLGGDGA